MKNRYESYLSYQFRIVHPRTIRLTQMTTIKRENFIVDHLSQLFKSPWERR